MSSMNGDITVTFTRKELNEDILLFLSFAMASSTLRYHETGSSIYQKISGDILDIFLGFDIVPLQDTIVEIDDMLSFTKESCNSGAIIRALSRARVYVEMRIKLEDVK